MVSVRISDIKLFNALKGKLGDAEAEQLVDYVKTLVNQEVIEQVPAIATKEFLRSELVAVESRVETKIAEAKFQLILWAFVFWATQLGAMFAFLKFLK